MISIITYLLPFLTLFSTVVFADQAYIYSPNSTVSYQANDVMDIVYQIRSMGMNKIWGASAQLIDIQTNSTVDSFPELFWNVTDGQGNMVTNNTIEGFWTIPNNVTDGKYTLIITASTTYKCSENNNGKAPFASCHSTVYSSSTFSIHNVNANNIESAEDNDSN